MADLIKFAKIAAVVKFTIMPAGKKNRKFSDNCKIAYVSFKNFKDIPVENPLVGSGGQLVVKKSSRIIQPGLERGSYLF